MHILFATDLQSRAESSSHNMFASSPHALAWLDKCLPVLNGLLITRPSNKQWLLHPEADITASRWLCGLWPLVSLLTVDIPDDIALYAGIVLVNLSAGPHPTLQDVVRASGWLFYLFLISVTTA